MLVHSGDVSGGHYFAFIRPTLEPTWYRFDDDRVSKSKPELAIDDNFGGEQTREYRQIALRSHSRDF